MSGQYDRRLHGVAVYNPDLLGKDELMAQFVARRSLLDQLLADLRRPGFHQHQVIVGHRGMGKTTLLRMIRFSVESDAELSKTWLALTFPEEQYNVSRLSDFYVNCADALSDALEDLGRRTEADALDAAIAALPRADEERRTAEALELLRGAAARLGVKLLLLVDNFELITERLSKNEASLWALRELLSREPWLLLIAASPVVMGSAQTYEAPFYDFFHTHDLHALSIEESKELLRVLAAEQNEPQVAALVESDPARIETLHTLAGGNPRTMVLLFGVLSQGAEGDVRTDLERLLDICTPLYKARFEELPAQAQQVIDALAIHWDPISAGELAEQLRLDVNAVSSQLNRLAQQGIVEKVEYEPDTKTGFQVAERFFNIWYLMRASRRLRRRLTWLVQFLKLFFGAEYLAARASSQLRRDAGATADPRLRDAEFCLALADALESAPLKMALEYKAVEALVSDAKLRPKLGAMLDVEGDGSLAGVVDRQQWASEFAEAARNAEVPAGIDKERFFDLLGGSTASRADKLHIAKEVSTVPVDTVMNLFAELEKNERYVGATIGNRLAKTLRLARRKGYLEGFERDGLIAASMAMNVPELVALAGDSMLSDDELREMAEATGEAYCWFRLGRIFQQRHCYAEASDAYKQAVASDPQFANAQLRLAALVGLDRPAEAETMLSPVMSVLDLWPESFVVLGALQLAQGRPADAEVNLRRALELDPNKPHTILALGAALVGIGRFADAIPLLQQGIDSNSNAESPGLWILLIEATFHAAGFEKAMHTVQAATKALPANVHIQAATARFLLRNGEYDAGIEAAKAAVRVTSGERQVATLATALTAAGRWTEAIDYVRLLLSGSLAGLDEELWLDYRVLFGLIAERGLADEAGALMDETSAFEQLRPLREALRYYDKSRRGGLRKLAPEVRTATREILKWWSDQLPMELGAAVKRPPIPPPTKPVGRRRRRST